MRAGQCLHHDLARLHVRIQHLYVLAVDHHVFDSQFLQVQRADKAQTVGRVHTALEGVQVDRATDFLFRRHRVRRCGQPQDFQRHHDDRLNQFHDPRHRQHQNTNRACHRHRHRIRACDCIGLRQHFGEDKHENCHHGRGHRQRHAARTEQQGEQRRCQNRRKNIDQVIAQQDRANQALAVGDQPVDGSGALVAFLFQLVHPRTGGCCKRRLRSRKEPRHREQDHDCDNVSDYHSVLSSEVTLTPFPVRPPGTPPQKRGQRRDEYRTGQCRAPE